MKVARVSLRRFLLALLFGTPVVVLADTFWWEPRWVKIRKLRLRQTKPLQRIVHITDLHYKGDRPFLESVVRRINRLAPDVVCFTGDLVEEARYATPALEVLRGLKAPLFGIPGNHDYWSNADFDEIGRAFAATGGAWLVNAGADAAGGNLRLLGWANAREFPLAPKPQANNILLMHYPAWVHALGAFKFDLILAGHAHGGQVRVPFFGPLLVPFDTGRYNLGLYQTAAGPLYVGAGLGTFFIRARFNCRPEIAVFEL